MANPQYDDPAYWDVLSRLTGVYVARARARSREDLALLIDGVHQGYGAAGLLDLGTLLVLYIAVSLS